MVSVKKTNLETQSFYFFIFITFALVQPPSLFNIRDRDGSGVGDMDEDDEGYEKFQDAIDDTSTKVF